MAFLPPSSLQRTKDTFTQWLSLMGTMRRQTEHNYLLFCCFVHKQWREVTRMTVHKQQKWSGWRSINQKLVSKPGFKDLTVYPPTVTEAIHGTWELSYGQLWLEHFPVENYKWWNSISSCITTR